MAYSMEAAWTGDIETIRKLTLQAWGPEKDEPPLKMAITDSLFNSPFSLAFLRGHYGVAKAILEIVKAQWTPQDKDDVRYKLQGGGSDDELDEDEYSDDDTDNSEPRIVSEKVDKNFTIDNIGQVSMQVASHVKPLSVITDSHLSLVEKNGIWKSQRSIQSLFAHCLNVDDAPGLKFLLDLAQQWAGDKDDRDDGEETNGVFTFPQKDFQWALENGKTQQLGLVIKRTGAGIPLDHLVKKSGIEIKQKPKYYQGLTVYGKKRYVGRQHHWVPAANLVSQK
jgi:hypothetical protein